MATKPRKSNKTDNVEKALFESEQAIRRIKKGLVKKKSVNEATSKSGDAVEQAISSFQSQLVNKASKMQEAVYTMGRMYQTGQELSSIESYVNKYITQVVNDVKRLGDSTMQAVSKALK